MAPCDGKNKWRGTSGCDPTYGQPMPSWDLACNQRPSEGTSGYCDCSDGIPRYVKCSDAHLPCEERCARPPPFIKAKGYKQTPGTLAEIKSAPFISSPEFRVAISVFVIALVLLLRRTFRATTGERQKLVGLVQSRQRSEQLRMMTA